MTNNRIESYDKLRGILQNMKFEKIDEEFNNGRFIKSRWLSDNSILEVENDNVNVDDAGIKLRFVDEIIIKCSTKSEGKFSN